MMDEPGDAQPAEHVAADLPCISCGYNLRTLLVSGSCPECGQPVAKTARHGLVYADIEWVRTVRRGAATLAGTPIVVCASAILCVALGLTSVTFGTDSAGGGAAILGVVTLLGGAFACGAGILGLTSAPPDSPRMHVRSVAGGAQICFAVLFASGLALCTESLVIAALILSTLLLLITLLAVHAKRLAERAGAVGVAKLAAATAWLGGVSLGVVSVCASVGGVVVLLLPSYGGIGWAVIQGGILCFGPVTLLGLAILGTVLMFRVRGMLDQVIAAVEAASRSADSAVPTPDSECAEAGAE